MDFGEKLRNAREDLDLSQADVAKQIPMNQSNYSKIERGMQEPSMDQLRRICLILNLDPAYLLSLNDTRSYCNGSLRTVVSVTNCALICASFAICGVQRCRCWCASDAHSSTSRTVSGSFAAVK